MPIPQYILRCYILFFALFITISVFGQITLIQDRTNATVGLDRKNFNSGSTAAHSDGYAHDFTLPTGTSCQKISSIQVLVNITSYTLNNPAPGCTPADVYINVYKGCGPYTGGATCAASNLVEQPFYPPSHFPGVKTSNYGCPLNGAGLKAEFGDNFSVDIVPIAGPGCNSVASGYVNIEYTITVIILVEDISCSGVGCLAPVTTSQNCDDGDPCTINDVQRVLVCDNSVVCVPCAGTPSGIPIVPTFAQLGPYCQNSTPVLLPYNSTNEPPITGTWSPAVINTLDVGNQTYIFTPDAGQCGTTTAMDITITAPVSTDFDQLGPYCQNTVPDILPSSSNNIPFIEGTWSPSVINTSAIGIDVYTFTPNSDQCGTEFIVDVVVAEAVLPSFDPLGPYCLGAIPDELPFISNNSPQITGVWSPDVINTSEVGSTGYTFTPDFGQCASETTMTVDVFSSLMATAGTTAATCGQSNGSFTVTWSGGTSPYDIFGDLTQNDATSPHTFTNVSSGSYTVTVIDAIGCTTTTTESIGNGGGTVASATSTTSSCGLSNGSVRISWMGGVGPFNITGDLTRVNASTPAVFNNLMAGTYNVTVTDANNCTSVATANVGNAVGPTATATKTDATCGADNGRITVTWSGGVGPFTISGDLTRANATTPTVFNNLMAGQYNVTVTDANGCTSVASATVGSVGSPTANTTKTDATCGADNGSSTVTWSGGVGPFNISGDLTRTNVSSPVLFSNLALGTYNLTLTDANGCTSPLAVTIIDILGPVTSHVTTNTTCGADNGTITVIWSGGVGPFNISGDLTRTNATTPAVFNNLIAGQYNVTIIDANGCAATFTQLLDQLGSLNITPEIVKQISCAGANDAMLRVDLLGTNGPFDIIWRDNNGVQVSISQTVVNVGPGTYTVQVTDKTGCSNTRPITIVEPSPISFTSLVTDAPCFDTNGQAIVNIAGGSAVYNFKWVVNGTSTVIDTDSMLNAKAGEYKVTVIHPNNCEKDTTIIISEPKKIEFPAPQTRNVTCFGLSTGQVAILGAPSGLTFNWSSGSVGPFAINYAAGQGWVYATEGTCTSDTVFFNIGTFPQLAVDDAKTKLNNPTCFGSMNGSVIIAATGGTGLSYTYTWSNGFTGAILNNIGAGQYIVTINDSNNCSRTDTFSLNVIEPVIQVKKIVDVPCYNQQVNVIATVQGGNSGYNFEWQKLGNPAIIDNDSLLMAPAGKYIISIINTDGCRKSDTITIVEPDSIMLNAILDQPNCDKLGSITLDPTRGKGGYTYMWSNATGSTKNIIKDLPAGTYTVTVTDASGCKVSGTYKLNEYNESQYPKTNDDIIYVSTGNIYDINLIDNDVIKIDEPTIVLGKFPSELIRFISISTNGQIKFEVKDVITESILIDISICDRCKNCSTSQLIILNEKLKEITQTTLITPSQSTNSTLQFSAEPIPDSELWIYNRWGQQILHSKNYQNDWDASGYPGGVYYYVFKVYGFTIKRALTVVK
jgi:CHU_C Type IX secretion signal domain/SprB repeat